ncbi:hypothetical protein [Niveispirillum sp.]|uniref:hypothetical protein n=1 Tax=Niveispirillum sp. TaxID=1917217 RepID=UPI001B7A318F|nr:hypothetical protein [Niveispirillum sp.]MBP7338036.1 hypothetical protein [Niveispirillum sp.]
MTKAPRLLVTIPHFFKEGANAQYGSGRDAAVVRVTALRCCISSLHQALAGGHAVIQVGDKVGRPIEPIQRVELDIVVCTVGDNHLLGELQDMNTLFTQEPVNIPDPMLLGFECQRIMKERFGQYDWYAFMEDDLIITDPWFITKLAWFQRHTSPMVLLQPNRFEISGGPLHKVYIDGDLCQVMVDQILPKGQVTMKADFLGLDMRFVQAKNPHSGTYFLTAAQLQHWMGRPSFLDYDTSLFGPLESAATYGVLRTFQIFKPHVGNAAFLEIQHHGQAFIRTLLNQFPMQNEPLR